MNNVTTKQSIQARKAVARFLRDMQAAAERSFDVWHSRLIADINECNLDYDSNRALLEIHPLADYYFAGMVALEAAKIRGLFPEDEATELLGQIAEQADGAAARTDRVVSDLVFHLIGRIDTEAGLDKMKMPYDQVAKAILERLGVDRTEATKHLMREVFYRHNLGEPLARGVPQWWKTFQAKYAIAVDRESSAPPRPGGSAHQNRVFKPS